MSQPNHDNSDIGFQPDIHSASAQYAERFAGIAGQWLLKQQQEITRDYLAYLKPQTAIDVGGGHGQNVVVAESLSIPLTVTGSHECCQQRVSDSSRSQQTTFMLGALNDLPIADQQFPVVISYRIISHMQDWQGFITELTRLSSDAVIIDFASRRSINLFSELAYTLKRGKEQDTRRFNVLAESEVDASFARNGYKRDKRRPQFFFPMAIHRSLKSPAISNLIETIARCLGLNYLFGSPIISLYRRTSV